MAANPFLQLVLARVKAKGGWSPVLERVAAGEALTKIAKTYECSRYSLYKLLHKNPKLWALYEEARRQSAMALAEEGTEILDELDAPLPDGTRRVITREDVALARERVAQRRWLAAAYDRETFGLTPSEGSNSGISIGSLHLKVLMAPPAPRPQLPSGSQPRVVEAEVISEEPAPNATQEPSQS